ncbi:uncharacterized protein At1g65710 [Lolium perenne]|uniref:uncharacterized protein At1g65710 n=1 Tax=Lolium perenne TaxID=4522 RepID=UPI0021EAEC5A|nr:uncharacterized protein At1g65710-like [Lolium perenne]
MGLCFSKKQPEKAPSPPPVPQQPSAVAGAKPKKPSKIAAAAAPTDEKAKKAPQPKRASNAEESAVAGNGKKAAAPIVVKAKAAAVVEAPVVATVVAKGPAPVRTSSCTKEEVDAILIQCGRLSRSSSGTGMAAASSETGGHRRSKRSCDLDRERSGAEEDGDWERVPVSRPSPHRGSPQRKRSGSRERTGGGGGSRRSSRSPGRRGEGAASASCGGARQQPGKMVSVPAREKGPAAAAASSGKRCASPRSSSPARVAAAAGNENAGVGQQKAVVQTPSLSRSSSRKAEQSPLRRSPMAEIDENSLRNNSSGTNAKPHKKSTEIAVATPTKKTTTERPKEQSSQKEKPSETRAPSSKTTTGTRTVSVVAESTHPRSGCRSRRASRDFDQNPNLYLLEDIQSYHTSAAAAATPPSFTLPACVSKAQSIVDAVADLNSSSSGSRSCGPGRSADDKGSVNAAVGGDVDVDLAEPSVHRYVSVRDIRGRGETEMQESAGSNTLSGNVWTPSCESTDRTWSTSRSSNHGDEVVEQPRQIKQRPAAQPEPSGRSRAGSSGANNAHRGRSAHRGSGSGAVASGRSGARGVVSASS